MEKLSIEANYYVEEDVLFALKKAWETEKSSVTSIELTKFGGKILK